MRVGARRVATLDPNEVVAVLQDDVRRHSANTRAITNADAHAAGAAAVILCRVVPDVERIERLVLASTNLIRRRICVLVLFLHLDAAATSSTGFVAQDVVEHDARAGAQLHRVREIDVGSPGVVVDLVPASPDLVARSVRIELHVLNAVFAEYRASAVVVLDRGRRAGRGIRPVEGAVLNGQRVRRALNNIDRPSSVVAVAVSLVVDALGCDLWTVDG